MIDEKELRDAMSIDDVELKIWEAQAYGTILDYFKDGLQVAHLAVMESDDGGIEWTKFRVVDYFKGNGLYTAALKYSIDRIPCLIAANVAERDFYIEAGFDEYDDDYIILNVEKAKGWLKAKE